MPPVGFEPTIPAGERPKTHALDRAATAGTGNNKNINQNRELPACAQTTQIYAPLCYLINSHYSQNLQCRPSESQMCELVGQVTSAKSDAGLYRTAVSTQQFILNDVYGCFHQGPLQPNKTTGSHQKWELANKVRHIAPTLDKAQSTFASILHACASYDRGNETEKDRPCTYISIRSSDTCSRDHLVAGKKYVLHILGACL
jgi:hypothetical protein